MAITLTADHEFAARYLADGSVKVKGFDVQVVWPQGGIGPAYGSLFTEPAYDIMVVPISNFLIALDQGMAVVGLPVFPDVFFPHLGAQVNRNAGIGTVKDLEGKRVGLRGWGFNPATWLRGALADVYGLDLTKVEWVEAEPNSLMKADYQRPARFNVRRGGDQVAELASGALDAVFFDRSGPALTEHTARLFDDPLAAALEYRTKTGVFPVNVMLAARRSVAEANPGLLQAVVEACDQARARYDADEPDSADHMGLPLGWLRKNGLFPHPNGLAANRTALEAITRYAHDMGLTRSRIAPEAMFFVGAR